MKDLLDEPNIIFKSYRFDYRFVVPFHPLPPARVPDVDDDANSDADMYRSQNKYMEPMFRLQKHKNPFIGRSVIIQEDSTLDLREEREVYQLYPDWQQFLRRSKFIMNKFGNNIWHPTIFCSTGVQEPLD